MIKIHLSRILGEKKLKRSDLKRKTGIRDDTITAYYYEYIKRINKEDLDKICKALNCRIDELLEYIPDEE